MDALADAARWLSLALVTREDREQIRYFAQHLRRDLVQLGVLRPDAVRRVDARPKRD